MPELLVTGGLGGSAEVVLPGPGTGGGSYFGRRYWGRRAFGRRYWGTVTSTTVPGGGGTGSGGAFFGRRYWGPRHYGERYWGSALAIVVPPPTADFLEALRTRLLSLDGLEDLTDVYRDSSPPYAEYPYFVFSSLFGNREVNTSSSDWGTDRYQFDVFSQDSAEAKLLGQAASNGLLWDASEPLLFAEGYEMARNPAGGRGLMTDPSGATGGLPVHRYNFDVEFLIGRG